MRRILVALMLLAALAAPVSAQADYTIDATAAAKINLNDRWANYYLNNPASTYATSLIRYVSTYVQMASTCTGDQVVVRNTGNTAWECRALPAVVGDITGVTAGAGLAGGGSSGGVTLTLRTDCADGQVVKSGGTGTTWTCAADNDTTYSDMVGDSGTGGTHGLVPAPAAGDAFAGKYLKADGTWTAPASGGLATSTSVTTATVIGSVTSTRVAASTGTIVVTGSSSRTGDLHVEITASGEPDGACLFQWKMGSEAALNGFDLACASAGTAIASGLTIVFVDGGVDSFEDGDDFTSAITWETSLGGFDCGIVTIPHMDTPGTGGVGKEEVLVHWDATRIASAAAPVTISTHTSAAGMLVVDTRATAQSEARFTILNWSTGDWTDEVGIVTLCRP